MRILSLLLLLLAAPAYGEVRSWTIYTEAYTANAELVEVRGNDVFLRIDGKVQRVPLFRLSPDDQHYIALLQTANVFPGPAADDRNEINQAMPLPEGRAEELPVFPPQSADATRSLLIAPAQNQSPPDITRTPPADLYPRAQYGQANQIPTTTTSPRNYATQAGATAPGYPAPRMLTQQQIQQQQQAQRQNQNRANNNSDRS